MAPRDAGAPAPVCKTCGNNQCTRDSKGAYHHQCTSCTKTVRASFNVALGLQRATVGRVPVNQQLVDVFKMKPLVCELCGFVPVHPSQIDLDHRDKNRANNTPENIQYLCANCHRLKSALEATPT